VADGLAGWAEVAAAPEANVRAAPAEARTDPFTNMRRLMSLVTGFSLFKFVATVPVAV
jgi:hypothetical protein